MDQATRDAIDAIRYRQLKELMGHLQDGSQTDVLLCQDDATGATIVKVDKRTFWGGTLDSAIDDAVRQLARG